MAEDITPIQSDRMLGMEQRLTEQLSPVNLPLEIPDLVPSSMPSYAAKESQNTQNYKDIFYSLLDQSTPKTGTDFPSVPGADIDVSGRYPIFFPGRDNEEMYAQSQGGFEKAVNGITNMVGIAGATFINGTIGAVYGATKSIQDSNFNSFYNNDLSNSLNEWSESLGNKYAHYKTERERNGNWWEPSNLFTGNFLWEGIVKNLGFSLGAAASGFAWNAALKAVGLTSKLMSGGVSMASKADDIISNSALLPATQRLSTINSQLSSAWNSAKGAIGKGLMASDKNIVATFGTIGEAGLEALNNSKVFREQLINDFTARNGYAPTEKDLQEINSLSESVGAWSYAANSALLTITNRIQFPKIYSSAFKAEKNIANNIQLADAKYIDTLPTKGFGKLLYKTKNVASLFFNTSEAFEEGAQFAIQTGTQNYFNRKAQAADSPSILDDGILYGIGEALTTDEGTLNIFIGGVSGALQSSGIVGLKGGVPVIGQTGKIGQRGVTGYGGEQAAIRKETIDAFNNSMIKNKMKEAYANVKTAEVIQGEREAAIRRGDILESKDLEFDYAHNFITTRLKYNAKEAVNFEIEDLKQQAITDFLGLQQEGFAAPTDTKETFLQRLDNLQAHVETTSKLYDSLNLKYKGLVNPVTKKPVFSEEVIDKMVYAASKVADYDLRAPQLAAKLRANNVSVDQILEDVVVSGVPSEEAVKTTMTEIDSLNDVLNPEDLKRDLEDLIELSLRRKQFLEEYNEIKNSPEEFKTPDSIEKPVSKKITLKTKIGETTLETNVEYFLGRVVETDKDGKPVYRAPRLTILGENEDGTIQIKTSSGVIRNVSKEVLEDYQLGKVSDTLKNKKAKYFLDNWNVEFEHYGRKDKQGKPAIGRLEWNDKGRILLFKYIRDGKERTEEVTGDQFVAKPGYKHGLIKKTGTLSAIDIQKAEELAEDAKTDPRVIDKRAERLKILTELYDELTEKQNTTLSLIDKKQKQIATIKEDLSKLEKEIENAEKDDRPKKSVKFKSATKKALASATKLSKMKDQLENQIASLEKDAEEIEYNISYVSDIITNIDDLPTDSKDLLEDLKESIKNLEEIQEVNSKQLSALATLVNDTKKAIESFTDFISELIKKFESKYPDAPRIMGQEYEDFLEANPTFLQSEPNYRDDLSELEDLIANVEEGDIVPNQARLQELQEQVDTLEKETEDLRKEIDAKATVLNKFKEVAKRYKEQEKQKQKLNRNKQLREQFLGTLSTSIQNNSDPAPYEPAKKKPWWAVVGGTIAPSRDQAEKSFNIRANTFGFNFPKLANKDDIKGIIVTKKTQDDIIPGLVEHLAGTSGVDVDNIIALVMVQENANGTYSLVDENGLPIPKDADPRETAIFQVFPTEKLQATYDEKEGPKTMFRDTTPKEVEASLRTQYTEWRKIQLDQKTLPPAQGISASFGIPKYLTDENARSSAEEAGLITPEILGTTPVVKVSTNEVISSANGAITFKDALGRVFLSAGGGLVKLFNRTFNKKEATTIFDVILQVSKNAEEDGTLKTDRSQRLFRWLESTVYWGIAKNLQTKERKPAGYNNIWFENVKEDSGEESTKLFISGKGEGYNFTPQELENNKEDIIMLLQNMYNNTNATMVNEKAWNSPYFEITGIDANGEPITKQWENYQTYLLSSEGREVEDIPLTTRFAPITEASPVNKEGIYFTLNAAVDTYTIPESTPTVTQEGPPVIPPPSLADAPPAPQAPVSKVEAKPAKVATAPAAPTPVVTQVFNFEGKENTTPLGTYGEVTFKVNGKEFLESDWTRGFSFTAPAEMVANLMAAKNISKEDAADLIGRSLIDKFRHQLQAWALPKNDPITPSTEEEDDEWDSSAPTAPDDTAYRLELIKQAKQFEGENWAKAEQFLKTKFGILPVYRVKNVIQATNGRQAWGMLHNGAIYLSEAAEIGTVYHEVFEAVWKMFATAEEKVAIIKEFKNREGSYTDRFTGETVKYSEATDAQIKEELAEEFRDYQLFNKQPDRSQGKSLIARLFRDIVNFFKAFFTGNNAANNTEELFQKISSGYYNEYNPYMAPLSYAKMGIIDIEEAYGGPDAEYRLETIPANQVKDIMEDMTFSTIRGLIKEDKSIFTIESINKADLYNRLREEVLGAIRWKGSQYETAGAKGELTSLEAAREVGKYKALWKNVKNDWEDIVKKHQEYLKTYSIEFDENDNTILTDENNSGREDYQDARKIDTFRKANSAIKLLLASLPVVQINAQGLIKNKPSSIGGANLIPSDQVFITLMNELHSSVSPDEMLNRLKNLALGDPGYAQLYYRLTKLSLPKYQPKPEGIQIVSADEIDTTIDYDNLDESGLQLVSAFWKTFKRQNPDVITVFVLPEGKVVISDSTLSSAAKQARRDMLNNIVDTIKNDKTPYVSYNPKTFKYNATSAVQNYKLSGDNLNTYITFLKNLGIEFDIKAIRNLTDNQLETFRDATEGLRKSVAKISDVKTLSLRTLDISNRLLELGTIQAIIKNPTFDSTYFNINGERSQNYIGTNALSNLYDTLSKINNLRELEGTDFAYLLTDVFSQGSEMLNKMFYIAKGGGRRSNTSDLMKPAYIDGTVNEQNGKSKESSNLTSKERLIQELNLNLKGVFMNLVPGDASIEWAIKMFNPENPFVSEDQFLTKSYLDIFKNYFISEVALSRDDRNVKDSKDLRFFKAILGETLHKKVISKASLEMSPEEVYNQYEKEIKQAVEDFIKQEAEDTKTMLSAFGIVYKDEESNLVADGVALGEDLTEETLNTKLRVVSANYIMANIEMHKLLYSDPYQYSDELKRIKNFNSPRQPLVHGSPLINAAYNKEYNKGYSKGDIAYTDMNRDVFRTSVVDDVYSTNDLKGYESPYEETDGGGFISLKANRVFGIRSGEWTTANEDQYRYDMAWEKRDRDLPLSKDEEERLAKGNPNVRSTYTPRKPIVSGNKADGKNYNDVVLDKFALVPLSYRILKQINPTSNALKLYEKMQKEDVDYVVFSTGRKVGANKTTPLYKKNGEFNTEPFAEINNIPFSITGVQTEVPSKDTPLVTRGSQITKLVTLDFLEAGMPIDFESDKDFDERYANWIQLDENQRQTQSKLYRLLLENQRLLEEKTEAGFQSLLKKLGITESIDDKGKKSFTLENPKLLADTLRSEILKREVNENLTDAFDGFEKGEVVLEATPAYKQIRNILYSIADKAVVSPKISGGMKVQITSALLESARKEGLEFVDKKGNTKLKFSSDILKFYENKDGERVCEVMIGRWFKSNMSDEALLDYLNNTKEGQSILNGVAFRIPTQKQNSIDVFRIKKFLPEEFGDSVVVPSALVKKAGSDFDIDKLSMYLKNVYIDNMGKPKAVPYFGIGKAAKDKIADLFDKGEFLTKAQAKELDRYIAEEREREFDVDTPEYKLIRDIFPEAFTDEAFAKEFVADLSKKGLKQGVVDNMYVKSLENGYITSLEKIISHEANFNSLTTPNSADQLKDLAKDINKKLGRPEVEDSSVDNMLSRRFMSGLRQAFVRGKYAIGIAAVAQTNHAQNQRSMMYIDTDRLGQEDLISEQDKKWLGDGSIKFTEYNSVLVNGKRRASLSMVKNAERSEEFPNGQNISDIIGQFIDGYVDIAKGPWIMELGATPNTASTWLFLVKIGVPIKTIGYFMNQPIIVDYLRSLENQGYSWLFNGRAVNDMMDIYTPQADITVTELPNEELLGEMIGKSTANLNNTEKAQQQLILLEFLKYAKMGEHLFKVTQGTNFDTATINDPYLLLKKEEQLKEARKTIISSVDNILNTSFIGPLRNIMNDFRDAYATIFISDKYESNNGKPSVRNVMSNVLRPYINMSDRDFVKIAQKATSDLFDWAVQTDTNLNDYIASTLLGSETADSAARKINEFKNKVLKDKNHPLRDNLVISSLKLEAGDRKTAKPNNLYITSRDNKVYDPNQVIYAFRQIRDYLGETNSQLYNMLVRVAILQSGTSPSPISFTSLLPYEDFVKEYNPTLSMLENIPNLEDFYNLNVFERNNWNNSDIVFFKPYTLRKSKKGRFFNPNMAYIDKNLTRAMEKAEIPRVIKAPIMSEEGRSDFMVYTWENRISKADKAKARKKGDRSYINKGLFQKVYTVNEKGQRVPLTQVSEYQGNIYTSFIYKQINAWGDSFRANEFYDYIRPSVIDNDFIKVEEKVNENNVKISSGEVSDDVIANILYPTAPVVVPTKEILLKDGKSYTSEQLNTKMLLAMGYTLEEAGRIINQNKC